MTKQDRTNIKHYVVYKQPYSLSYPSVLISSQVVQSVLAPSSEDCKYNILSSLAVTGLQDSNISQCSSLSVVVKEMAVSVLDLV